MSADFNLIKSVNAGVNAECSFRYDEDKYRQSDFWADALESGNEGDCEDYAIAKLRRLLALGYAPDRIKIGLCYGAEAGTFGGYHAVLVAEADGEDYVLDNRYPHPTPWKLAPYKWDKFYLLGEKKWVSA